MKAVCTLELEFPDPETAGNIAKALELDNGEYLEARVECNVILVTARADGVMALRNTLDDFLACAAVAQRSLSAPEKKQ